MVIQRLTQLALILVVTQATFVAQAKKFFFEPYVGIGKLELTIDDGSLGNFKDVTNGFFAGAKLGVNAGKKLFLGLDYHLAGPFKFDENLSNAEWNHVMKGAGLGLDYKIIRFWAGYYFDSEFDDSTNNLILKGTALKVGFGLRVKRKIRANLDLVFYDTEEIQFGNTTAPVEGFGIVSTHVSVSFPIPF